ncbi:MAG TPA: hypothetical protein DCO77_09260 [Nitrospiraceae bacterium]|nr:hypothetical protein [Nitrospiraceae bacterium]
MDEQQDNSGLIREMMPCVRCGQCRSVCPVFSARGVESDAPRGKVALVRALLEGTIEPNAALIERIDQCLLCQTCVQDCPSGVRVDRIVIAARERIARQKGVPIRKKFLTRWLMPNLNRLRFFITLIAKLQGLIGSKVAAGSYRKPRYRIPITGKRLLPDLTGQTLHTLVQERPKTGKIDRKVMFFSGCMITYVNPGIGKAVLEVCERNHVDVVVPEEQVCCGLPSLAAGDRDTFEELRQQNLAVLMESGCDTIITACASCGSTLKEHYGQDLPMKIYDFSEFLSDHLKLDPLPKSVQKTATYHDPCHLRKAQKIKDQPRSLLKRVPGLSFQDVKDPDRCCGFGGTFSMSQEKLSQEINDTTVKQLIETGAEMVVTSCPGCMLHLANGLHRAGSTARVVHLAEVLAASCGEITEEEGEADIRYET